MEYEYKNNKRKDRIKNAAIIFLIVMLVLTLFSNTILNFSLPQVAVIMPNYGTISEQIRGSGTITPAATTEVKAAENNVIDGIMVKEGDNVKKGDTLFTLSGGEGGSLDDLQTKIDDLQYQYDKMLLTTGKDYSIDELAIRRQEDELADLKETKADIPALQKAYDDAVKAREAAEAAQKKLEDEKADLDTIVSDFASGNYDFLDPVYVTELKAAEKKKKDLEDKKSTLDLRVAELEKQLSEAGGTDLSSLRSALDAANQAVMDKQDEITAQRIKEEAPGYEPPADPTVNPLMDLYAELQKLQTAQQIAQNEYNNALSKESTANGIKNQLSSANASVKNLDKMIETAVQELADLKVKINKVLRVRSKEAADKITEAKDAVTEATAAETEAKEENTVTEKDIDEQITKLTYDIETAKLTLLQKQQDDATAAGQSSVDLKAKADELERAKEKLEKAKSGGTITAPIDGLISSMSAVAGQDVSAGDVLCIIAVTERGYELSFSVSTDQARRVNVGVTADIQYFWGGEASAKLARITNDPSDPNNKKLLTFAITGDISAGQTLQLSVGQRSSDYSSVIPSSAIREDNNGKFVLACVQKSTPVGSRYTAERIAVNVVATNGQSSAIDGSIENGTWIITTSTKPISPGTLVRLQN